MSFWGGTATKSIESKWAPVRRAAVVRPVADGFVPIDSQVSAVRELLAAIGQGCHGVVIHGPSGSGRSVVSRQLCRVSGGLVLELNGPPLVFEPSLVDKLQKPPVSDKKKIRGLLRIDGLTLEHCGWEKLAAGTGLPGFRPVLVASTAWWLWHRQSFGPNWHDVCLKLLAAAEIEQLANGMRWRIDTKSKPIDGHDLKAINEDSEGIARKVIELALKEI